MKREKVTWARDERGGRAEEATLRRGRMGSEAGDGL